MRSHGDILITIDCKNQDVMPVTSLVGGTAQPVKQHVYRVNPIKRELLQKEVDYLLAHNLSEPSYSSWGSPCILVSKPDNLYRFCKGLQET